MQRNELIEDIRRSIAGVQHKLDLASTMGIEADELNIEVYMTRKEAAAFIGRSTRQLDRLCEQGKVEKVLDMGSIRIRRSSLLRYKGLSIEEARNPENLSDMERIFYRYQSGR